nr:hypothetical protein [Streptomyces sp. 2224.1]
MPHHLFELANNSLGALVRILTAAGVTPRVVMEILEHSQISITMDVYTHVVQDTREAISHMDRLLKRRPGRQ